jgi:hypothetical protein
MENNRGNSKVRSIALSFTAGVLASAILLPATAAAIDLDLGEILRKGAKIVGIKAAVDEFGDEVNDGINKLVDNNDVATDAATKVVAIVSPIGNKHVGAAQVVGPREAVERVGVVVQLETSFMDKLFRAKVLIPVEGRDANDLKRVQGVGVSAVIDIKL